MKADYFDTIDTPEKAYWLGFIAADGCVTNDTLVITLKRGDRGHLEKFLAALEDDRRIYEGTNKKGGSEWASVRIRNKQLIEGLAKNGITPRKTWTVEPWAGPDELMPHYWRGVLDGDGWVSKRENGHWQVGIVGNTQMIEGFRDYIAAKLGRTYKIYKDHSAVKFLCGGVRPPREVVALLYANPVVALDRKYEKVKELLTLEAKTNSYSNVSRDDLLSMKERLGTWNAVAEELGTAPSHLRRLRRKHGLDIQPCKAAA